MVKDISEIKPGITRFNYGFFTNVKVTEITEDEVHFVDKGCNKRVLKMVDFMKSATLKPETIEVPEEPVQLPKKEAVKQVKKFPIEEDDEESEEPVKPAKKRENIKVTKPAKETKPPIVGKPAKEKTEKTLKTTVPAGYIGIKEAEAKYKISSTALRLKLEPLKIAHEKIGGMQVKESDIAKHFELR